MPYTLEQCTLFISIGSAIVHFVWMWINAQLAVGWVGRGIVDVRWYIFIDILWYWLYFIIFHGFPFHISVFWPSILMEPNNERCISDVQQCFTLLTMFHTEWSRGKHFKQTSKYSSLNNVYSSPMIADQGLSYTCTYTVYTFADARLRAATHVPAGNQQPTLGTATNPHLETPNNPHLDHRIIFRFIPTSWGVMRLPLSIGLSSQRSLPQLGMNLFYFIWALVLRSSLHLI